MGNSVDRKSSEKRMTSTIRSKRIRFRSAAILCSLLLLTSVMVCQVFMDADSAGDAYTRITSKGYGLEVPDVLHPVRHITEPWDPFLHKYVFEFVLHKEIDGDSNERIDRQRNEIKTYDPSPETMKASYGETHTYRWKFKIDSAFIPTSQFCHIHQIKAGDGPDAGSPLMTLTPRAGSPDKLELIFTAPSGASGSGKLNIVDLTPFKGTWVEAYERIRYTEAGSYSITIKRVRDDSVLFNVNRDNIAMWRTGSTFIRPKYGIYRSLGSGLSLVPILRDEYVRFADFYLAEGALNNVPEVPGDARAIATSHSSINLSWVDRSNNENLYRIDRSTDGSHWSYLATVRGNVTMYADMDVTASRVYHYRIRSENSFGNSDYSNSTTVATDGTTGIQEQRIFSPALHLANYPNPFNPTTTIEFSLPNSGYTILQIVNVLGKEVATLVDEFRRAGVYRVPWDASHVPSGFYYSRLKAGNLVVVKRMVLTR
ncbi:MAG: T9SS type A sorting domain-containing protein [bacterium]